MIRLVAAWQIVVLAFIRCRSGGALGKAWKEYLTRTGTSVHTFWFPRSAPGMTVKFSTKGDGLITNTVTKVADTS